MKRNMIPIFIAIVGAILTILGAVIQYREKEQSKEAATKAKKEAAEFNAKLLESQTNLIQSQKQAKIEADIANSEIIRLNKELVSKTEGLLVESNSAKKTQQETINFILGSGLPELSFYSKSPGIYSPALYNSSSYPMYDISITIDDYDKILSNCPILELPDKVLMNDECVSTYSTHQGTYFIAPGARQKISLLLNTPDTLLHYRIQCISRVRVIIYYCVIKITNNNILSAIRIHELKNDNSNFVKQINNGLIIEEKHWKEHFYLPKPVYTGPLQK